MSVEVTDYKRCTMMTVKGSFGQFLQMLRTVTSMGVNDGCSLCIVPDNGSYYVLFCMISRLCTDNNQ